MSYAVEEAIRRAKRPGRWNGHICPDCERTTPQDRENWRITPVVQHLLMGAGRA